MVAEEWKARVGVHAVRGGCPERTQKSRKHERWPLRVNYSEEAGSRRVHCGSGNPDDSIGTSSGVPRVQGAGGISLGGVTPRQMTYVVGLQSQVPKSPLRSHHSSPPGGGGSTGPGRVVIPTLQAKGSA
jgi:hypothetical protein